MFLRRTLYYLNIIEYKFASRTVQEKRKNCGDFREYRDSRFYEREARQEFSLAWSLSFSVLA